MTEAADTDWCTGFPETWNGNDISHCCQRHDVAYETGQPKIEADVEMAICFFDSTGDPVFAAVALLVVLVVGIYFYIRARQKRLRAEAAAVQRLRERD